MVERYVLMPEKLTHQMAKAGDDTRMTGAWAYAPERMYKAMIAARPEVTEEVVERVARKICECRGTNPDADLSVRSSAIQTRPAWRQQEKIARAVIAALGGKDG